MKLLIAQIVSWMCIYACQQSFVNGTPQKMQSLLEQMFEIASGSLAVLGNHTPYNENPNFLLPKYDFIIVGAGPAGCVLANRLSERRDWNVLLIEAGLGEGLFHQAPILAAYLQATTTNWNYKSTPQKRSCFGMRNNECALPRGKSVGGTSSLNYMIYNRGNRRDFDRWAEAGNYGWSYQEVLPYFKKSERSTLRGLENSPYHGHAGPLSVEDVPYQSQMVHAFIEGAQQLGIPQVDYNGESQIGISYVQANTQRGQRHSAARAYIEPIRNRKNLHILANSRVTRVLIDPESKKAYGIEFLNHRKFYAIKAAKEVILSSGTFNSPQLLMLSGVGPRQHLRDMGIPLMKDLPVGEIMYEHMSHFGPTFVLNSTGNRLGTNLITIQDVQQFFQGSGKLTSIGGVESLTFAKTPNSKEPADFPDVELIFVAGSFASDEGTALKEGANIKDEIYDKVYKPLAISPLDSYSNLIMHFHPKSFGYVKLRDKNPLHWPIIEPNYFEDEDDLETILHGIKQAIRMSKSPAMQRLGTRIHDIPLPGCEHLHFGSDNYWRCSIRTLSYTLHHQVATCKMGTANDPTAVVSPELKVHGINRLRVADTSVIPFPITAHTNAASFMIGEKLADLIKSEWLRTKRRSSRT